MGCSYELTVEGRRLLGIVAEKWRLLVVEKGRLLVSNGEREAVRVSNG